MSIKADLLAELDGLIAEGNRLNRSFSGDDWGGHESDLPEEQFRAFTTSTFAAIQRIAGSGTHYYKLLPPIELNGNLNSPEYNTAIPAMIGCLVALRDAVDKGLLVSLEARLRANIHDDFLQQAKSLLDQGYHVAAMVLIGGVLEDHLEKLCTKHGKTVTGNGNLAKYNDALHGATIYDKPAWRRIQSIGDVRNDAAHGNFAKVNVVDVQDAHKYVGRFLADYPA
jgi:hypothetical protein